MIYKVMIPFHRVGDEPSLGGICYARGSLTASRSKLLLVDDDHRESLGKVVALDDTPDGLRVSVETRDAERLRYNYIRPIVGAERAAYRDGHRVITSGQLLGFTSNCIESWPSARFSADSATLRADAGMPHAPKVNLDPLPPLWIWSAG